MPSRLGLVLRHNGQLARASIRWLVRSREHTNLTYRLTALNERYLVWFVSELTGASLREVTGYMRELEGDDALRSHIESATAGSDRWALADAEVRYARRIGWYAIVRAIQPDHVVETGTDKGMGSCVLAAALLRNGHGRVTTIDINPDSGYLIQPPYDSVIDRRVGDSISVIEDLKTPITLFIHDSDHSAEHEASEFLAAGPRLVERALVLSDNSHVTDELAIWAERRGWRFAFFAEEPKDHWYPGDGIGAAWLPAASSPTVAQ